MPAFTPRRKNKQTGQYECEGCRSGRPGMPLTEGAKHADVEDQISHGVMVAIVPPEGLAESLDIDPDIDDAHVTLVYLGKDHEIDQGLLYATTKAWAASHGPLTASVSGYGVFPVTDDGACLYATVDSPGLNEHRADLLHALGEVGIVGPSNHGFTPHMTLRYGATEVPLELPDGASDSWPIESVYVVHGPNWFEVPLAGAVKEASVPKTAQQPDVCRNCGDAIKWDSASMTWRSENPEPCTSPEGHWPFRPATGRRVVAHDSGDTEKVFHCPFCGGGQVIGRSDGTIECGYCKAAFTVQVQPMHSGMPQTDPATGQPIDMPGMPGERGEAGVAPDPATTGEVPEMPDPAQPASQVPDGPPQGADAPADPAAVQPDKPTGEVPPQFRKGSAREVRGASRATIRRVLAGAGIPMVRPNDAMGASLVEFVDFTGIMSSVHEPRASHAAIIAALDAAGIAWEQGNYIMVPKPTVVEAASYYPGDPYWTTARRDGPCAAQGCARGIKVGDDIFYYPKGRSAYCPIHAQGAEADFLSARGDEDFYNGVGNPYAASRSEPMYVVDGMALDRTAFLKRMALAHADDRQAVLSQIKAERISG